MATLRELDVVARIAHPRLLQGRIAVLGQTLIDASPEHQITAEHQPQPWRRHRCSRLSWVARRTGSTGTMLTAASWARGQSAPSHAAPRRWQLQRG
jgi:hypothetical protein